MSLGGLCQDWSRAHRIDPVKDQASCCLPLTIVTKFCPRVIKGTVEEARALISYFSLRAECGSPFVQYAEGRQSKILCRLRIRIQAVPYVKFPKIHSAVSGELFDSSLCHGIWHKTWDSYPRIDRGHIDDGPPSTFITHQGHKMPCHQRTTFDVDCIRSVQCCNQNTSLSPLQRGQNSQMFSCREEYMLLPRPSDSLTCFRDVLCSLVKEASSIVD